MASDDGRPVPFRPLNLTQDEEQQCRDLTFQVLDRTLRSYDERDDTSDGVRAASPLHHANLSSTKWKQLKTQADASLYAERSSVAQRDLHLPGDNWENPVVLLAVGTIEGELDEVMLGMVTPDFLSVKVRSETLANQPLDGAVLAQLTGSTDTDPFQFMSVTWLVGEKGWPLSMVVRPRDFVLLTAMGTMARANGERIGYEVVQPANLPQCPPLPKPMTRGKIMYGAIYRQLQPGIVDVYIQMYVETRGHIVDKLVVNAMWNSTLGWWDSPRLAELKKLKWYLDSSDKSLQATQTSRGGAWCPNCREKRGVLTRRRSAHLVDGNACAKCLTELCSNCRIKRCFKVPNGRSVKLQDYSVVVCAACLALAKSQPAAELAKLLGQQRQVGETPDTGFDSQSETTWSSGERPALTPSWSPGRDPPASQNSFMFSGANSFS